MVSFTEKKSYSLPATSILPEKAFFPHEAVLSLKIVNAQEWFTRLETTAGLFI